MANSGEGKIGIAERMIRFVGPWQAQRDNIMNMKGPSRDDVK